MHNSEKQPHAQHLAAVAAGLDQCSNGGLVAELSVVLEAPPALLVSTIGGLLGRVPCWCKVRLKATRDCMQAATFSGARLVLTVLTTESVPAAAFSTVLPLQSFCRHKSGMPRPLQQSVRHLDRCVGHKSGAACELHDPASSFVPSLVVSDVGHTTREPPTESGYTSVNKYFLRLS